MWPAGETRTRTTGHPRHPHQCGPGGLSPGDPTVCPTRTHPESAPDANGRLVYDVSTHETHRARHTLADGVLTPRAPPLQEGRERSSLERR